MKVAITATSSDISGNINLRFGRSKYFIIADTETGAWTAHDNTQNMDATQGAGIQAVETVARLGAAAVITGNVGPKAFRALQAAGIKIYLCEQTSVAEAIRRFGQEKLKEAAAANAEGHWA